MSLPDTLLVPFQRLSKSWHTFLLWHRPQVVLPSYDALIPKVDTLVSLLDQTIASQTANAAATADVADAMTAVLGLLDSLLSQYTLNTELILSAYSGAGANYAAYADCIRARVPYTIFTFSVNRTELSEALRAPLLPANGAAGRRLLQAKGGNVSAADYSTYDGYVMFSTPEEEYSLADTVGRDRVRYVGFKGNTVFGGLFIHQVCGRPAACDSIARCSVYTLHAHSVQRPDTFDPMLLGRVQCRRLMNMCRWLYQPLASGKCSDAGDTHWYLTIPRQFLPCPSCGNDLQMLATLHSHVTAPRPADPQHPGGDPQQHVDAVHEQVQGPACGLPAARHEAHQDCRGPGANWRGPRLRADVLDVQPGTLRAYCRHPSAVACRIRRLRMHPTFTDASHNATRLGCVAVLEACTAVTFVTCA